MNQKEKVLLNNYVDDNKVLSTIAKELDNIILLQDSELID